VAQPIAVLLADINAGASLNQRLMDAATLDDTLVKGSNAADGSADPQLVAVSVLPSTVAGDVVNVALEQMGCCWPMNSPFREDR
jgi:hypothetical protein